MTDPISDMLTRIRNAILARKREATLPYSRFKHNLADLFVKHGWLEEVAVSEEGKDKVLKLILKYDQSGLPVISGLARVSKPGQRIYSKNQKIPRVRFGKGATVISTSKGLMTDGQARAEKIGGEIICQIW